jgi:hypothetical protein
MDAIVIAFLVMIQTHLTAHAHVIHLGMDRRWAKSGILNFDPLRLFGLNVLIRKKIGIVSAFLMEAGM